MRGLFLAVFALLIVAGDSGRYTPQLIANGQSALNALTSSVSSHTALNSQQSDGVIHNALALLWQASQHNVSAQPALLFVFQRAFDEQFHNTLVNESIASYWLEKLATLKNADAAWLLYQMLGEDGVSNRFMHLAAIGDVAEAQLALAMSTESPEQRETWLVKAAAQNYLPAQAALADWYLLHGEQQKAKPLLSATAKLDMQSAFKYARLLWAEGAKDEATKYFTMAAESGHNEAKRVLTVLARYTMLSLAEVPSFNWKSMEREEKACVQRIQPFATSLGTVIRADSLYASYLKDERLLPLSLCIAPPVWIESNALECDANYKGSGVLGCNVTPLSGAAKTRQFNHAIVIAEQGKANVQNGVMYLDIGDTYSVFVHELAHFAGFADEYPMGKGMANRLCDEKQIAQFIPPNIVVDSEYWYSPSKTVENWLNIDPATIIAKTKTCALVGVNSYKPSRRITFMEHHDSGVIPPIYLVLWEQQLQNKKAQRPISMNFFQAFHQKGEQTEAAHWLSHYEAYTSPVL